LSFSYLLLTSRILIILHIISSKVVTSLDLNSVILFFSSTLYPLIFHNPNLISQAILTYSVLLTPNTMVFCQFSYNFLSLSFAISRSTFCPQIPINQVSIQSTNYKALFHSSHEKQNLPRPST